MSSSGKVIQASTVMDGSRLKCVFTVAAVLMWAQVLFFAIMLPEIRTPITSSIPNMSQGKIPIGSPRIHLISYTDLAMQIVAMLTVTAVQYGLQAIMAWKNYPLFAEWMFRKHFDPIRGVACCVVGPISYLLLGNLVGIYDVHLHYLIMSMCAICYGILFIGEALPVFEGVHSNPRILEIFVRLINTMAGLLSLAAWSVVILYLMANCNALPRFVFLVVIGSSLVGPLFAWNHYNWFSAKLYGFAEAACYNTFISVFLNTFIAWTIYFGLR